MKLSHKLLLDRLLSNLFTPLAVRFGKPPHQRSSVPLSYANATFVVAKVIGAGSVLIALPNLLALRREFPKARIVLLANRSVCDFAALFGVFDSFLIVDDESIWKLGLSIFPFLFRRQSADVFINLEAYSGAIGVLGYLMGATLRVGAGSKAGGAFFYERFIAVDGTSPYWQVYDKLFAGITSNVASRADCENQLVEANRLAPSRKGSGNYLCLGIGCSNFGSFRKLSAEHWARAIERLMPDHCDWEVWVLGTQEDAKAGQAIKDRLTPELGARVRIRCGETTLPELLSILYEAREFWGIDSALLHFARILGVKSRSFWGPTLPNTRLRSFSDLIETVHHLRLPCSPCIHVHASPPCGGTHPCMDYSSANL